jgi:ketosteroid isomerase-like protein
MLNAPNPRGRSRPVASRPVNAAADLVREFHLVQGGFLAGGDVEPLLTLLSDDVVWHVPGRSSIAGEYRGREAVRGYFEERRARAASTFRVEIKAVLAEGELVMQLADGTAERDGERGSWRTVGVFRVHDERIAECWVVPFDLYAFDEIWA